jgi:hypothetical protein
MNRIPPSRNCRTGNRLLNKSNLIYSMLMTSAAVPKPTGFWNSLKQQFYYNPPMPDGSLRMSPDFRPAGRVYIIRHGNGAEYSKLPIGGFIRGGCYPAGGDRAGKGGPERPGIGG